MIPWLTENDRFPPVERALKDPNGLLAAGADLSLPRLVEAYQNGIFPWYSDDQPLLWWSPDPRMVLFPDELRISVHIWWGDDAWREAGEARASRREDLDAFREHRRVAEDQESRRVDIEAKRQQDAAGLAADADERRRRFERAIDAKHRVATPVEHQIVARRQLRESGRLRKLPGEVGRQGGHGTQNFHIARRSGGLHDYGLDAFAPPRQGHRREGQQAESAVVKSSSWHIDAPLAPRWAPSSSDS